MRTPICANARAVARVSSPSRNPLMRDVPSASAASMTARCEIDLSPGTRSSPRNGPAGALIQSTRADRRHASASSRRSFSRA